MTRKIGLVYFFSEYTGKSTGISDYLEIRQTDPEADILYCVIMFVGRHIKDAILTLDRVLEK